MMDLHLPIVTFNSYGGSSVFSSVMALVELYDGSFGQGLESIEMSLFFKSALPFGKQRVNRSLEDSFHEFHEMTVARLPVRRFLRKKRRLQIEAIANFATAEELEGVQPINLAWQAAALDLLIRELEACRKKFKATDDFRLDEFLDWLDNQRNHLPKTVAEAEELERRWRAAEQEKRAALDEWESLGIDWEDHHDQAREVVSDHRLWSQGNDFAPNGNDTGADLIDIFREQKTRWARGGGKAFYNMLARDWEFDPNAKPGDSIDYDLKREVIMGLAFTFLKLFAYCPNWLVEEATQTIENYRLYLATHHLDWPHRDECLMYQELMMSCLTNCPQQKSL